MEEAPENGKESSHSAHDNGVKGMNEPCIHVTSVSRHVSICCKQHLLAFPCQSVHPDVSIHLPRDGFMSNLTLEIFYENLSKKIQIWLKSDTHIGHFT